MASVKATASSVFQNNTHEYRDCAGWKTLFTGGALREQFDMQFEPMTAREVRLSILDATDGPTLSKIELFEE